MATTWFESQVRIFQWEFDKRDKRLLRFLPLSEICEILEIGGFKGTEEDVLSLLSDVELDENDCVSRDDFLASVRKIPPIMMQQFLMRRDFWVLDKNRNGRLSRDEIMDATKSSCPINIAAESIAAMLISCARSSKRELDYEEFLRTFNVKISQTLEQVFLNLDKDGSGFLTKEEILSAMRNHRELNLKLNRLVELLIACYQDDDERVNYRDFIKAYTYKK